MHRNRGKRMKLMSRFGDDGGDEARMAEQSCVSLIGVLMCLTVQCLVGAAIGCDVTTVAY